MLCYSLLHSACAHASEVCRSTAGSWRRNGLTSSHLHSLLNSSDSDWRVCVQLVQDAILQCGTKPQLDDTLGQPSTWCPAATNVLPPTFLETTHLGYDLTATRLQHPTGSPSGQFCWYPWIAVSV